MKRVFTKLRLALATHLRRCDSKVHEAHMKLGGWAEGTADVQRIIAHNRRCDRIAGKLRDIAAKLEGRPDVRRALRLSTSSRCAGGSETMSRTILAIALIALVTFTAPLWTPLLLDRPAVLAFVLSDRFWPAVLGMMFTAIFICAATFAALVFHPGALRTGPSGRRPEGGE